MSSDLESEVVSRIQEYIPDLRRHVHGQIIRELSKRKQQILEHRTQQIREMYWAKLQQKANEITQNVNNQLLQLRQQSERLKQEIKNVKAKVLTEDEKEELIETTIAQVRSDEQMVQEIKAKMYEQTEQRIFDEIERSLNQELEAYRQNYQEKLNNQRIIWENERYQYWKQSSKRDLEELAEEYRQLECKKTLIHESLVAKKTERDSLQRYQRSLTQKNNEIAQLKREIKLLS